MQVRPTPLFRDDVDSADPRDDDTAAVADTDVDETLATQGPEVSGEDHPQGVEASGENQILVPSIGLLDPEGYVDMREPWVEGAKGEKVRPGGMFLGSSLMDL
jgi:hypothetical protein